MKKGWEIKRLGDVCDTGAGGTPLKAHKDYYEGGTIPWLQSGEVSQGEIFEARNFITEKGLKNSSARLFPKDTVLIAMYGATAGQVGILRFPATTNQAICGILPNNRTIPAYLFYCFLSKKEELIAQAVGGAQPNISQIKIKNTRIPIPSLPEQQRIVSILDETFSVIANAKEDAEKNLANAREVFESYLKSVLTNPGEAWEEKRLKDIGITQTGTTPSTKEKENFGSYIPFVKPADIDVFGNGEINCDGEGLSEIGLKRGRLMPNGSILMVCIGASIGKVGITAQEVSCNQQINALTVKSGMYPRLFYYGMRTKSFFDQVIHGSAQATLPIINKSKWENLTICYPKSNSLQQSIASTLDSIAVETKKLETIYNQKLSDLDELKKSILEKAFNGELNTN